MGRQPVFQEQGEAALIDYRFACGPLARQSCGTIVVKNLGAEILYLNPVYFYYRSAPGSARQPCICLGISSQGIGQSIPERCVPLHLANVIVRCSCGFRLHAHERLGLV